MMKENEEKNKKIDELQKEVVELREKKISSEHTDSDKDDGTDKDADKDDTGKTSGNEIGAFTEEKLQELIAKTIKSQLGESSTSNGRYIKPYTKRIDSLRMPLGYQPPKFQQFDGKGNPKQHIAHFVETCNNAGTDGDRLVKQFVRSLKGIAFDWYTDLDSESIDSWGRMEDEFLNRFYSTRRIVSMSELTNIVQWEDEPVVDYIDRWRALSLQCKDRLSESSAVEMCINGMIWDILYIMKGIKPKSFPELATLAHDMEITIKGRGKARSTSSKAPSEKKEFKKTDKGFKSMGKEAMVVETSGSPVKISSRPKFEKKKESYAYNYQQNKPTLKELQAKKYPFPDSDLSGMLDDLLEKKVIQLPESKRPDQANKTSDPNYCRYHRLVSHPLEKCITLKEKIMQLFRDGKIILDLDETVATNQTTVILEQQEEREEPTMHHGWDVCMLQFGSLEPVAIWFQKPLSSISPKAGLGPQDEKNVDDDDEGWTLVTRKKTKKQVWQAVEHVHHRRKQSKKMRSCMSDRERKSETVVKPRVFPINMPKQKSLSDVALEEFLPRDFLNNVTVCTISAVGHDDKEKVKENEADDAVPSQQLQSYPQKENEVVKALNALPANMGWRQIFHLPKEKRQIILQGLDKPELYAGKMKDVGELAEQSTQCVSCNAALTFSDEDLLLGSKPHNRPLYVSGYIRGQKVNRILIDGGSGVNLMPKATMKELGITVDELSSSRTIIHGFNLNGERAIGMIRVNLSMGDLSSETLFHVIEARTSFKLLLGRPWKHENGVVASTLHQCLKYYRGGERKINGDAKPFTKADSFFADAKFFEENGTSSEFMPTTISSTGKGGKLKENTKEDVVTSHIKENDKQDIDNASKASTPVTSPKKQEMPQESTSPVLRYIPKSRRKEGDSPFAECLTNRDLKDKSKPSPMIKQEWMAKVTTPLPSSNQMKVMRPPPVGFVCSSNQSSSDQNVGIFDSNSYKLLAKAGYDFTKPTPLGKVVEVEPYGLNKTQQGLFKQEGKTKAGLGYKFPTPVKISARRNRTTTSSQHITVEEAEENEAEGVKRPSTSSVFDRISPPAQRARPSIFDRLGRPSSTTNRPSVFTRLDKRGTNEFKSSTPPPCTRKKGALSDRLGVRSNTVFTHLGASNNDSGKTLLCSTSVEENDEEVNISDDLRSAIPSRMKRLQVVDIIQHEPLKARRRVLVLTGLSSNNVEESKPPSSHSRAAKDLEIVTSYHITAEEIPDDNEEVEADKAPKTLEDEVQSTIDDLKELNLGTDEDPRPIYVSALLTKEEEEEYYKLLVEYKDVFAWSYKEMPGLSPKIAVHRWQSEKESVLESNLNVALGRSLYLKSKKRYPTWIANIVPVRKKNGQLRVCVDFRDLNDACPKDDFPLPVTELMIDATTGHKALSFMDCTAGYNQIQMAPEDQEATAFRTPKGIFCYTVMPFGLKNAGATYQGAMQKIFDDMLHKTIECYVDGVVVKSKKRKDHVKDLQTVFERLRKCQLKMNPLKCAFGVTSRKFLGIKKYLASAPVLGAPIPGKPLILYIAAQERSLGAMCAQEIEDRKERALYYLSRTLVGAELNYSPIEKICLALVFAIQKLRHYMQAHTIHVVSKADPIKYILSRPVLSGRLAKWAVLLKQYDLVFVSQKAIKGQVIADFFADHPVPTEWELSDELPGEEIFYVDILPPWQMYFDGAARRDGAGAGVVFISPQNHVMPYSFTLTQFCSNNVAEYQALILGLQMAIELGVMESMQYVNK
ncbi:uncharacterized protein LOC141651875 [Silene latifolia]|uniref:uncharacterized protein LOC141651875 n=1 Tax=Silene latifolia TaxID=37657 RepID=UPI003D7882F4